MMQWILDRFKAGGNRNAFIHNDEAFTYHEVVSMVKDYHKSILDHGVRGGEKVVVVCDYSPQVFCFMLALALNDNIIIPLSRDSVIERDIALSISGVDWLVDFDADNRKFSIYEKILRISNSLLDNFISTKQSGIILFSSGSTGVPKAILHSFERVASKFIELRSPVIGIPFLLIDHFGGINTILGLTLSLGTVVTISDRSLVAICTAIERHGVELLPVTPSFLNLLLMSNVHKNYDLSSLKRITYGTEVMSQLTLDRLRKEFPNVILQQTYGLSEVGVLHSKSRDDGSLWVRVGGNGFELQVREGILWVKSKYSMIGYLNSNDAFDNSGWFNTQDRVVVDGDYLKILGRESDIINVAGQKVYPAEVEDCIKSVENIADVSVFGEKHNMLGNIIVARVLLLNDESLSSVKVRIRQECQKHLASYKIPTKVIIVENGLYSVRQKKIRR
jgi:acyl-CoA synthetase (AMP-forming)/AMP-acid ligase II